MALFKWSAPAGSTLAGAELNSLAFNARVEGQILDNTVTRYPFANFELYIPGFAVAPTADTQIQLYFLPTFDGTNYTDGSASIAPSSEALIASFTLKNTTSAQRIPVQRVFIDPLKYKTLIVNSSNQNLPAANNTLKIVSFSYESV